MQYTYNNSNYYNNNNNFERCYNPSSVDIAEDYYPRRSRYWSGDATDVYGPSSFYSKNALAKYTGAGQAQYDDYWPYSKSQTYQYGDGFFPSVAPRSSSLNAGYSFSEWPEMMRVPSTLAPAISGSVRREYYRAPAVRQVSRQYVDVPMMPRRNDYYAYSAPPPPPPVQRQVYTVPPPQPVYVAPQPVYVPPPPQRAPICPAPLIAPGNPVPQVLPPRFKVIAKSRNPELQDAVNRMLQNANYQSVVTRDPLKLLKDAEQYVKSKKGFQDVRSQTYSR